MAISQTHSQGNRRYAEDAVVDTMLAYRAEWRVHAVAVTDAYHRYCATGSATERARLFAEYSVALDRERLAADRYARVVVDAQRALRRPGHRRS